MRWGQSSQISVDAGSIHVYTGGLLIRLVVNMSALWLSLGLTDVVHVMNVLSIIHF